MTAFHRAAARLLKLDTAPRGVAPKPRVVQRAPTDSTSLLRPAALADLAALERFIAAYSSDGTLLPRTRANLRTHWREFVVLEHAGEIAGCGALQPVDRHLAEVRSVAVRPDLRGAGHGGRIVERLVERAATLGLRSVFCLTRRVDFFARHGFQIVAKEKFPQKIWNDCRLCPRQTCCDEVAMERTVQSTAQAERR
jgi:amino-acid N-acetyltransferase